MDNGNVTVKVLPDGLRVSVSRGFTLLDALRSAGVRVRSICGGRGTCGKCRVVVRATHRPEPTEQELRILGSGVYEGHRLACQFRLEGDAVVIVPEDSREEGKERLVVLGVEPRVELNPGVIAVRVKLDPPTLEDNISDERRLLRKLSEIGFETLRVSYGALRKLPLLFRSCSWDVNVVIYGDEVLDVVCPRRDSRVYGFAVDVGTTKIAGFLVDLSRGSTLYAAGEVNPQVVYGEDVMSRITYAITNPEGLRRLQASVVDCINDLIDKACKVANVEASSIYEVVVVGNTAMVHFLLGVDPRYLGLSPYVPAVGGEHRIKAREVGLRVNAEGYVYVPPSVAGFVGADFLADLLVVSLINEHETSLILDIGTNAEVGLKHGDTILACSAAAGPALEGGHIRYGMRSMPGAIERVWIDPCTLEPKWVTIGGLPPRGVCGSGIIDAVGEMLVAGIIDSRGRIKRADHRRVRSGPDGMEYVLAWKEETASMQEDIVVTQRDVGEVQKAKAAIQAAWRVLLRTLNLSEENIEAVYVSGAFGNYVNPDSAITMGLLPEVPASKVVFLGNSAGSGARIILKDRESRTKVKEILEKVKYVELASNPLFAKEFVACLYLPHANTGKYPKTTEKILKAREACLEQPR